MDEKRKIWYLRNHKLFNSLSCLQIKQLNIISDHIKAKKGDIIYDLTMDVPRIYLLKEGVIKIVEVNDNGEEFIRDLVKKGDLFGELYLEPGILNNSFAKVVSDAVSVCSFSLVAFEDLLLQNPTLSLD
jgi:CRP-like cAMP-binding protein